MCSHLIAMIVMLPAGQAADTFGKTNAQILEMGLDNWSKFYAAHAGDSTAASVTASGLYGDLAYERNSRLIRGRKRSEAKRLGQIRKMLEDFGGSVMQLGYRASGGGTMWNQMSAGSYAEAEDTLYRILRPAGFPAAKPRVVSDVSKALAKFRPQIEHWSKDDGVSPEDQKMAKQYFAETTALYLKIAAAAAHFDRHTSDRILGYCLDQVNVLVDL